jgi:hypothetical protein
MMTAMYIPPTFPMYEFDDRNVTSSQLGSRWLPSWQGEVDKPAEEVCLGWFDGDQRQVVVLTRRPSPSDVLRQHDDHEAKYTTARIVYAGNQIVTDARPSDPTEIFELMDQIASTSWTWVSQDIGVNGTMLSGRVAHLTDDIVAGFVFDGDNLVCFAASKALVAGLQLRTVSSQSRRQYVVDPTLAQEIRTFDLQPSPAG